MKQISSSNFTSSINIKYDIGNEGFVDRYLPTPSHAEFLKGVLSSFLDGGKRNSHILVGPYGSGKSLVASVVANIFTGLCESKLVNLMNRFKDVDQEVYSHLNSSLNKRSKFIPVILSGYEGEFADAVINSTLKALSDNNIHIRVPGEIETIKNVISDWEERFPDTFYNFRDILEKEKGLTVSDWKKDLLNSKEETEWFKKIYHVLSAGAELRIDNSTNFDEKFGIIIDQLVEHNINIFIIYDEFGRYMQGLDSSSINKAMQDIQDLAEIVNRSDGKVQLLLISHKNMSNYMVGQNEEFKDEFRRIEKRFTTYYIESDKATFYRITQEFTKELQLKSFLLNFNTDHSKWILKKYNLFTELNHHEIEKVVIEGSYPIHPLSMFLLPRLSNTFGQNERTLFTFLESEETGGLLNFINKNNEEVYYPHNLFDYFFQNNIIEYLSDDTYGELKTFAKLTNRMPIKKQNSSHIRVLKLITLWSITNSNNVVTLNEELLAFGTGLEEGKLKQALSSLIEKKMIRFNRVLNQWELREGSSVFVDELIEEVRQEQSINKEIRINELSSLLERKYYLATDYNDEKNMTRFMKVSFLTQDDFLSFSDEEISFDDTDGHIFYVLAKNQEGRNKATEGAKLIGDSRIVTAILDVQWEELKNLVDKTILLKTLLQNKKLLAEYSQLEDEINVLLEENKFEIRKVISQYETFQHEVTWFNNNEILEVKSAVELEDKISDIMKSLYPFTPDIGNDLINRRNLNRVQKRAVYTVLNGIIDKPSLDQFGIEGQGPDYLVYATVFKNHSFDINNLDSISHKPYRMLREKIIEVLKDNPKGNLNILKTIFSNSPFGIRESLIPILFVSLIRDYWDQLMFYRNEMFVTAVDAEKLHLIFEEPNDYNYVFQDYDKEFVQYASDIELIFSNYVSPYVGGQIVTIRASSGLLTWLRQLPRHTQITELVDQRLLEFKSTIRRTEVNPVESLQTLKDKFPDTTMIKSLKSELEQAFGVFREKVKKELFKLFKVDNLPHLFEVKNSFPADLIKQNRLLSSIKHYENEFIDEFALEYTGVPLEHWSDSTFDLFIRQSQNDYIDTSADQKLSEAVVLNYGNKSKAIKKVELSTKAETVYKNVDRMIRNAGRSVPRGEIEYLIFKLLEEYVD